MSTADQHEPAIAPPEDAPLPWHPFGRRIYDDDGKFVGEIATPDLVAYVVAAANALPGLAAFARLYADNSRCICYGDAAYPCWKCTAVAALASLPEGVRP